MNTGTRPPPPQGPPPSYAFVTRVYRKSLRPVVIFNTILAGTWALLWGIASFRDISIDSEQAPRLRPFDIVLGVLYMVVFAAEVFGLVAATMQRLPMVKIYAFLALGAAIIAAVLGLIRVIVHFVFKDTLIQECVDLVTGGTITIRVGVWGTRTTRLDAESAPEFCRNAWNHDSFSEIAWFIVVTLLGLLFASVAFSYYRQMLDPSSIVNSARNPAPQHYSPPYASGPYNYGNGPLGGYGAGGYAPPQGPPPAQSTQYVPQYDPTKLPEYERGGYTGTDDAKGNDWKGGADAFSDREAEGSHARTDNPFAPNRV